MKLRPNSPRGPQGEVMRRKLRIAAYYLLWPLGFSLAVMGAYAMIIARIHPDN